MCTQKKEGILAQLTKDSYQITREDEEKEEKRPIKTNAK